ncbi:hypothetical protein EC950943_2009B, partial [Escherichia coli 95.0943]
EN